MRNDDTEKNEAKSEKKRRGLVEGVTTLATNVMPSAYVIAILLTVVVAVLALIFTPTTPFNVVKYWGNGFWVLMKFAMEMTLIIVTGYLLAVSPPIRKAIDWITDKPKTPKSAIATIALVAMGASWINWGLGLILGAFTVRSMARKRPDTDYRLMVATAYLGLGVTWHGGLSASAPLLIATPGHALMDVTGLVPITQTIFAPINLILIAILVPICCGLAVLLHPKKENTVTVDPAVLDKMKVFEPPVRPLNPTIGEKLNYSRILSYLIGICGLGWLMWVFGTKGFRGLNLDVVIFMFLMISILLHGTPASLEKAAKEAITSAWGVILQFPFYAGIFGIMMSSGLAIVIGHWFVAISNGSTFPPIVYLYSTILNYFIPSGGSKWIIEAPYLISAGKELGVSLTNTVVPYMYGDMTSNLIQPFWALPLIGLTNLKFKDIIGYCFFYFIVTLAVILVLLFILPAVL